MQNQSTNAESLAEFRRFLAGQKDTMKAHYHELLVGDLSQQNWDGLFERNVLEVMKKAYADAFRYLLTLPFDSSGLPVYIGVSELAKQILGLYDGYTDEFLAYVLDKHHTSNALSNFPGEHKPDYAYVNQVKHGIAEFWREFALNINAFCLERG